jgi:hypothetical protein
MENESSVPIQWGWVGPSSSLNVSENGKASCFSWEWNFQSSDITFFLLLCNLSHWCLWPCIHIEPCKLRAFKPILSLTSLRMLHVLSGGRYVAGRNVCKVSKDSCLLCHVSPSVLLSTWNNLATGGWIFLKFYIWEVLLKSVKEIQVG